MKLLELYRKKKNSMLTGRKKNGDKIQKMYYTSVYTK